MHGEARGALLGWFDVHKRELPWRQTRDPYAIWVSEMMLQQTRVAAVLEHYARWMERFPNVVALAAAEEPEVLALWSGLGYYRRARMLHRAAQVVVREHGGVVPGSSAALLSLPGIGAYTAAAIASIAFGEPVAVVDGNVERIAMRILGLGAGPGAGLAAVSGAQAGQLAQAVRELAQSLVEPGRSGDSNQAMMELGAMVCLPKGPLCLQCPLHRWCATRGEHEVAKRKALVAKAVAHGLAVRLSGRGDGRADGREVWLRQRDAGARLMAGMWELPELSLQRAGEPLLRLRHAITVTNYQVSVWAMEHEAMEAGDAMDAQAALPALDAEAAGGAWFAVERLPELALTGLARKVLRRLKLWPGS